MLSRSTKGTWAPPNTRTREVMYEPGNTCPCQQLSAKPTPRFILCIILTQLPILLRLALGFREENFSLQERPWPCKSRFLEFSSFESHECHEWPCYTTNNCANSAPLQPLWLLSIPNVSCPKQGSGKPLSSRLLEIRYWFTDDACSILSNIFF